MGDDTMKLIKTVSTMFTRDSAKKPDIALKPTEFTGPQIVDVSARSGYLTGQLLVATPVLNAGCFQKSVVYIFKHSDEGAMGLIVNQSLELINYSALLDSMEIPSGASDRELPVYFGGPVERARGFVLHSNDYDRDFTLARHGELAVTASSAILTDIMNERGPSQAILCVGYAGWTAGQLEAEIEQNSWITVPATPELVFATDDELKWATASKSLGIDMAFFSTIVGHA